jgi:hypothetical protein
MLFGVGFTGCIPLHTQRYLWRCGSIIHYLFCLYNGVVKMLHEIMVTQCTDRALRALVASVLILLIGGSANNSLSVFISHHFHGKCLFRRASWNPCFGVFFSAQDLTRLWSGCVRMGHLVRQNLVTNGIALLKRSKTRKKRSTHRKVDYSFISCRRYVNSNGLCE